jgi:hypothetical protein
LSLKAGAVETGTRAALASRVFAPARPAFLDLSKAANFQPKVASSKILSFAHREDGFRPKAELPFARERLTTPSQKPFMSARPRGQAKKGPRVFTQTADKALSDDQ